MHAKVLYALYQLDTAEFEQFIGKLWQQRGWETQVTRPRLDGGIDVIATRGDPFPQKHLIQVKRYAPDNQLSQSAVEKYARLREVEENVDAIIIVTTSRFSKHARKGARELNVKLLDGADLATFIVENDAFDIVEDYTGLSVTSKLKISPNINPWDLGDEKTLAPQYASPTPPLDSDMGRSVMGLEWLEKSKHPESPISDTNSKNDKIVAYEDSRYVYEAPICPECGTSNIIKTGTYERHPQGDHPSHPMSSESIQVQRYFCKNEECSRKTFSTSLPSIKDNHRYIDDMRDLLSIIHAVSGASGTDLQLISLLYFGVKPSDTAISNWHTISTEELLTNELPSHLHSGFYTYDEQYLQLKQETVYRLLVYDPYRRVPVAQKIVNWPMEDVIRTFLTTALENKPCEAVTTDGRPGVGKIIANDLNAVHHRCLFHLLRNFQDDLEKLLGRSRPPSEEKTTAIIIGSEFKQVFDADSYAAAIQRFEWVVNQAESLPSYLRKHVETVNKDREKFLGCLRDERIPRTIKSCERYFSHSQTATFRRRSFEENGVLSLSKQQMILRTVREGFIPHETGVALLQDNFSEIEESAVEDLYTEAKQQFLRQNSG